MQDGGQHVYLAATTAGVVEEVRARNVDLRRDVRDAWRALGENGAATIGRREGHPEVDAVMAHVHVFQAQGAARVH